VKEVRVEILLSGTFGLLIFDLRKVVFNTVVLWLGFPGFIGGI